MRVLRSVEEAIKNAGRGALSEIEEIKLCKTNYSTTPEEILAMEKHMEVQEC